MAPSQSSSPLMAPLPSKSDLLSRFRSKRLSSLRTPALILDVSKFKSNSERMTSLAASWSSRFRAHIKTLKTLEGTRIMLDNAKGKHHAIIVSTMAEAWGIVESELVSEGVVEDILYGLPLAPSKLAELSSLRDTLQAKSPKAKDAALRLMIDHPAHVEAINSSSPTQPWSVFVKVDCGYGRAGQKPETAAMDALLRSILASPHVNLYGLYSHGGHSYSTSSASEAGDILSDELISVKRAAQQALAIAFELKARDKVGKLILSVGSTPTAHAASTLPNDRELAKLKEELEGVGELELHAGNYGCLDLQQVATHAMPRGPSPSPSSSKADIDDVSVSVLAEVVGLYPSRAEDGSDEAMCDAGGLALSKDTGPFGGFGHVVYPAEKRGWEIAKVSQEHGVLRVRKGGAEQWRWEWGSVGGPGGSTELTIPDGHRFAPWRVGERLRVVPQHACMVAAAHPWIYVVDSLNEDGDEEDPVVVDVWVPIKGW